jgi:zinc transporter ZupT
LTALSIAVLAALCFSGASLLGLWGRALSPRGRSYAIALAAGILLTISFGDLFPESLETVGRSGAIAFVGGFALLFLVEALTRAHTHHAPHEHVPEHPLAPFALGLAIHNAADGFAIGVGSRLSDAAIGAVGVGVLVHQVPVGLSLAAVFAAARAGRGTRVRVAALLGLMIPLAAVATAAMPAVDQQSLGWLTGAAAGVLAYMGASHLLPEAQLEHPSPVTGVVFLATVAVMTGLLFTVLSEEHPEAFTPRAAIGGATAAASEAVALAGGAS